MFLGDRLPLVKGVRYPPRLAGIFRSKREHHVSNSPIKKEPGGSWVGVLFLLCPESFLAGGGESFDDFGGFAFCENNVSEWVKG